MAGPLDGIRVIDLSERSVAAANAGMVLSDLGAEVIRVEPEGGDPIRNLAGSRVWLRGQKSVILTPDKVNDGSWERLRNSADVILHTAHPQTDKPDDLLRGWNEDTGQILSVLTTEPCSVDEVMASVGNLSSLSKYPAYAELLDAKWGLNVAQTGYRDGPIFLAWPLAAYGAAWLTEVGVVAALFQRERTGRGQVVTSSMVDGIAVLSTHQWLHGKDAKPYGVLGARVGAPTRRMVVALFECSDGVWVHPHTGPRGSFNRLMKLIGREDLVDETHTKMWGGQDFTPEQAEEVWEHLEKTFKSRPSDHWVKALNADDICCMPALAPGRFFFEEQAAANKMVDIEPDGTRSLGLIAKYSGTPATAGRGVPKPGEHNSLLKAPQRSGPLKPAHPASVVSLERQGPLAGITVLDLGAFLAGPFAPRTMADLGARVIKVEEVGGEPVRPVGGGGILSGWLNVQRGKEVIGLNLKSDEARQVLYELVKKADIVHHNMRAAVLPRLGVGYEKLSQINPNIIYCHSTGYGNEGPWAGLPTLEPLHSALTGLLVRSAGEYNPPTGYLSHMDYGCGLTSTVATIAALFSRERSGRGQYLEVPQTCAGLIAMSDVYVTDSTTHETFSMDYDAHGHAPTNAMYQTQDGWIIVACYSEQEWSNLTLAMGVNAEGLTFAESRQLHIGEPRLEKLEGAFLALTTDEALERLERSGVPCAVPRPFNNMDAVSHPLLLHHGVIVQEQHTEFGPLLEVGHTIRVGRKPFVHTTPAPLMGQNSRAILQELGKSPEEMEALFESGACQDLVTSG